MLESYVEEREAEGERPGAIRRMAAGAWHVPAGFLFLLRRPTLWPLAILPMALAAALLLGGLVLGLFAASSVEAALLPERGALPYWIAFLITFVMWWGTLVAGMFLGLAVALLLAAPILERLSRQVELRVRGAVVERAAGLRWELAQSLRGTLYFLAVAPGVFLVSLIPVLGPALGALWGAHALAFQQTDAPLARRGLDFGARRRWHRRWRAESLGFGLAGLVTLLVPLANFLLAPALTVGGTLLVLELSEDPPPESPSAFDLQL